MNYFAKAFRSDENRVTRVVDFLNIKDVKYCTHPSDAKMQLPRWQEYRQYSLVDHAVSRNASPRVASSTFPGIANIFDSLDY